MCYYVKKIEECQVISIGTKNIWLKNIWFYFKKKLFNPFVPISLYLQ